MVVYAYRDLVCWFMIRQGIKSFRRAHTQLEKYYRKNPKELDLFLGIWSNLWLKKWRERVKILKKKVKIPEDYLCRLKKARKLYRRMNRKEDLKEMILQRLLRRNELSMTAFIAENLIIGEIARHIHSNEKKGILQKSIEPFDILMSLSPRIRKIIKEKGPLVYLQMGIHLL